MTKTTTSRLAALLEDCRDSPGRFNAAILGGDPFWWRQEQASQLTVRHHTVVLPWGNALGKSWWAGRLVLWWLLTRRNSLVVTTAPTHNQLDSVLWRNIRAAVTNSKYPLGLKVNRKPLSLTLGDEWQALGISTTKTERMSGFHSPELLVLVDEASGISPEIVEAIDGLGATKVVMIGNPLRAEGRFKDLYDQAQEQRQDPSIPDAERIVALRVPSTDSPDIHLDRSPRGLASGSWLRQMYRRYGKDSLWTRTHIRAEFPETSHDVLVVEAWLDWCARVESRAARSLYPGGPVRIGCDLGEGVGKDKTIIVARDDLGVLEVWGGNTTDLDGAALHYAQIVARHGADPSRCSYDKSGIGKQFANRLAARRIKAIGYEGSGPGGRDYTNLRAACAWKMRQRLDPGHIKDPERSMAKQPPFHIPAQAWWPTMREELAALRYSQVGKKIALEKKTDLKARLGRSPDYADALIQTWLDEVAKP